MMTKRLKTKSAQTARKVSGLCSNFFALKREGKDVKGNNIEFPDQAKDVGKIKR